MSLPVLIGFAGVLVAAVATGLLAGRSVRQPRVDGIVWTAATLALTLALAAQSLGFAWGFSADTFRAVQLCALLLAPLWVAWGLVEAVAGSDAARFAMRLVSAAVTVVTTVILATDPLTAQPFGKSWPVARQHFQPVSLDALDLVQAVAVIATLVIAVLAMVRAGKNPRWRRALTGIVPVAAAVLLTAGMRLSLPDNSAYPLLAMMAAALVWFGVSRIANVPGLAGRRDPRAAGRRGPASSVPSGPPERTPDRTTVLAPPPVPSPVPPVPLPVPRPGPASTVPPAAGPGPGTNGSSAAATARPYGRILIFTLLEDRVADFDRLAERTAEEVGTVEPDTLVYVIHLVPNAPLQRIFYEIYRDRAAFDRHESQPYMQRFVAERRTYVLATNVIELRLKYAKVAPLPAPPPAAAAASAAAAQRPPSPAQRPPSPAPRPPSPVPRPGVPVPQRLEPLPSGPGWGPQQIPPPPPGTQGYDPGRRSGRPYRSS